MSRELAGLTKHVGAQYYCDFCLHRFGERKTLDAHIEDCRQHGPQKVRTPADKWLKFSSQKSQLPVPFIIYLKL